MSQFNVNSRRKRRNDEDEDNNRNFAIPIVLCFAAIATVALGLVIALWIRTDNNINDGAMLRDAFTDLQDNVTALQNCTDCQLQETVAELQSNFSTFQNGSCTCPDNTSVVTLIGQGRFIWNIASNVLPSPACTGSKKTLPGYALVAGGTGYRVGDLFTVADSTANYQNQPLLEITSVGVSGDVLAFTVLGQGCLNAVPVGNLTFQTFSVVGTGLTVQMWAGAYTPTSTDVYYTFNEEIYQRWVAAPQYANYTLKRVVIGEIESTVLVLNPPELPLVTRYPVGLAPFVTDFIIVQAYAWDPLTVLPYFKDTDVYYMTQSNINAISLVDDTSCYINGSPCQLNGYSGTWPYNAPFFKNSISSFTWGTSGFTNQLVYTFAFTTDNPTPYDYVANNAVLTLTNPITIVVAQS